MVWAQFTQTQLKFSKIYGHIFRFFCRSCVCVNSPNCLTILFFHKKFLEGYHWMTLVADKNYSHTHTTHEQFSEQNYERPFWLFNQFHITNQYASMRCHYHTVCYSGVTSDNEMCFTVISHDILVAKFP